MSAPLAFAWSRIVVYCLLDNCASINRQSASSSEYFHIAVPAFFSLQAWQIFDALVGVVATASCKTFAADGFPLPRRLIAVAKDSSSVEVVLRKPSVFRLLLLSLDSEKVFSCRPLAVCGTDDTGTNSFLSNHSELCNRNRSSILWLLFHFWKTVLQNLEIVFLTSFSSSCERSCSPISLITYSCRNSHCWLWFFSSERMKNSSLRVCWVSMACKDCTECLWTTCKSKYVWALDKISKSACFNYFTRNREIYKEICQNIFLWKSIPYNVNKRFLLLSSYLNVKRKICASLRM